MPVYSNADTLIRQNLETIRAGHKVNRVAIGKLSTIQLDAINAARTSHRPQLPAIIPEIVFVGRHIYKSRVLRDGDTFQDVIDQN